MKKSEGTLKQGILKPENKIRKPETGNKNVKKKKNPQTSYWKGS